MHNAQQISDDDERSTYEFRTAASGIQVREQCTRCHCETTVTISGECITCSNAPKRMYVCTCGGSQLAAAGQSHVRCPQCSGVAV